MLRARFRRARQHGGMILRLDPRHPILWRTPTSAQLGIDPPAVLLDDVSDSQERMLAALAVGVSRPGLTLVARGDAGAVDDLLAIVAPALLDEAPTAMRSVAITGTGQLVGLLADTLARSGGPEGGTAGHGGGVLVEHAADPADLADQRPDLAVIVARHVVAPALHATWLRRDVPHLPVVIGEHAVTVGPIVEPGFGPCLLCVELHRRDADPAWPALATQLLGRPLIANSPALLLESAGLASRLVLERLAGAPAAAAATRIDARTGRRDVTTLTRHPDCGCAGIDELPPLRRLVPEPA